MTITTKMNVCWDVTMEDRYKYNDFSEEVAT